MIKFYFTHKTNCLSLILMQLIHMHIISEHSAGVLKLHISSTRGISLVIHVPTNLTV